MAWIYIFFCVTIMSTSAYKQYPSYVSQSYEVYQEPSTYQRVALYGNHQPKRLDERSMLVRNPAQYIHHDQRRSSNTDQEASPRFKNTSYRVVSNTQKRYTTIASRVGQTEGAAKDRVVFPGPISRRQNEPEVSDECKQLGFCEDVPDYPDELVKKIVANLGDDVKKFQTDKLDFPDMPDIAQRAGGPEDNVELCVSREKIVYPRNATDIFGNWQTVLNPKDNPLQGVRMEICDTKKTACKDFVSFQPGYTARCVQKYIQRSMVVLGPDGNVADKPFKIPICCACVAALTL